MNISRRGKTWVSRHGMGQTPLFRPSSKALLVMVVLLHAFPCAEAFTTSSFSSSKIRVPFKRQRQSNSIVRPVPSFTSPDCGRTELWSAAAGTTSDGDSSKEVDANGTSISSAACNLVKGCVGTGVLTLPWGLAAASDSPLAVFPASVVLVILAAMSAYSFFMIGRVCNASGASSLGDAWEREVGNNSAWVVSAACFLCAFGSAITYSILLGDSFCSLATAAGLKGWLASRQVSILVVTLGTLLPLCRLQSLSSLAPFSAVGTAGIFATCLFMALRSLPGGPYSVPNGSLLRSVAPEFRPSFGATPVPRTPSPSTLILNSMAALSYLAHFNAPAFFKSLGEHKALRKFGVTTVIGFGLVAVINICVMAFGFLTFGGNCSDIILNNYSHFDIGASICRLLMALSVIGSYPFMLAAMKTAVLQVTHNESEETGKLGRNVSQGLLAFVTCIAMVVRDAGFLVSLNGAIMGSFIIYIIPSILYRKSSARRIEEGSLKKTKRVSLERASNLALIAFGVAAAAAGSAVTVVNSYFPHYLISAGCC